MMEIIKRGDGNFPKVGSIVKVHYTGKVLLHLFNNKVIIVGRWNIIRF